MSAFGRSWWLCAALLGCADTFGVSLGSNAQLPAEPVDAPDASTDTNVQDAAAPPPGDPEPNEGESEPEGDDEEQNESGDGDSEG